ncbi:MAG: hypothetical protein ACFFG0_25335 [Candidatus Thorarchaeota archaeon]
MSIHTARQRIIKDITNEDERIQITGYVRNIIENELFILDDKSGEISIDIKNVDFQFKKDDLVNVIGDLMINTDGERFIVAEFIQDMNKLNFEYYIKLYELKKKYG